MKLSLESGHIERLASVRTIADGIAVKEPGENTFAYCSRYVDEIVTVTEDEISTAILAMIEQQKMVAEGAGAVSVAAAMFDKLPIEGKNVVCVVSGGNIDVSILSRVISRGLQKSGRLSKLSIELQDKPGQLRDVSAVIAEQGGNVVSVHYEHAGSGTEVNACIIRIELETKNFEHLEEVRGALLREGYKLLAE